jgi:hypothetical protein
VKRKISIVTLVMGAIVLLAGAFSVRFEHYLQTRNVDPGLIAIENLRDLYDGEEYEQVLAGCERAYADARCRSYHPEILYIEWVTNRRLDRTMESNQLKEEFLKRFVQHPLAAKIHFASAMDFVGVGDYASADKELAVIERDFTQTRIAPQANEIRHRLERVMPTASGSVVKD